MNADEDGVGGEIDPPPVLDAEQVQRFDVGTDEGGDGRRRDGVLDEDRGARGEATPRTQRTPREGVTAAGCGQGRGHLSHAEDQREVHAGDDDGGDRQAAEPALAQSEVPAGVVARDDVADAEAGQQQPSGGSRLQLALLQIVIRLVVLFHATSWVVGVTVATHGMRLRS